MVEGHPTRVSSGNFGHVSFIKPSLRKVLTTSWVSTPPAAEEWTPSLHGMQPVTEQRGSVARLPYAVRGPRFTTILEVLECRRITSATG